MSELLVLAAPNAKGIVPGTVIFFHGLGDSGAGWELGCRHWQSKLPHIKFILPTAPKRAVTVNKGAKMNAWYDSTSMPHTSDGLPPVSNPFTGREEARLTVERLIESEVKSGTPSDRIVLGGFSQGCGLVLFAGLQSQTQLGGILALSGYLPFHDEKEFASLIQKSANSKTPVLHCHGDADTIIPLKAGLKTVQIVKSAGVPIESKVYPEMAHVTCPAEWADTEKFFAARLPPTAITDAKATTASVATATPPPPPTAATGTGTIG